MPAYDGCRVPDINGPWVAGSVGKAVIVQRTLTAVFPASEGPVCFDIIDAAATALSDSSVNIEVVPASVELHSGESVTVTITVTPTDSTPVDIYQFGQVSLGDRCRTTVMLPSA